MICFVRRHFLHRVRHFFGHAARYAGVYLVEDDGGQRRVAGCAGFEGQHQAGYFAARGDVRHVLHGHVSVGAEEEDDVVGAERCGGVERFEGKVEPCAGHPEVRQAAGQVVGQLQPGLAASGGEFAGGGVEG